MKRLFIDAFNIFEDLYGNFKRKAVSENPKNLIVLFTGNDDPQTGKSWCPHCIYAKPVIEKTIENFEYNEQIVFATVRVGHREEWKRPDNPYRLHELKINCVPTLISLSNNIRLNGSECWDTAKVAHLFSNSL